MSGHSILVVGGAGYIGSHMVYDLLKADYKVVVLDNLSRGHRDLVPGGEFIEGDMGDRSLLDKIFTQYDISAVMHFAALSLVGESVKIPLLYYRNNVAKTIELLDAMKRHHVERFIFSSTAAVYGEPESVPILEGHNCNPTNPYGSSKLAVEKVLADCAATYEIRYASLRYFNAAGADVCGKLGERHDPETHLIPLALQVALGLREKISIFGTDYPTSDGTCIRDYIHVSDLTQAHLLAMEGLFSGRVAGAVYNLGNSEGYSVREVIEVARRITGSKIQTIDSDRREGDPAVLIADSTKIREELGWKPQYEALETIVELAWKWHCQDNKQKPGGVLP